MSHSIRAMSRSPLLVQLRWLIRLRWIAGAAVIIGAMADWRWLRLFDADLGLMLVGTAVVIYNMVLWFGTQRLSRESTVPLLKALGWLQIVPDLVCLTVLTIWTGGLHSPLLGFFVFHMVFASMLMSQVTAYAAATLAIALLLGGLRWGELWPTTSENRLMLLGWCLTLLLTVFLTNTITASLRQQRRRLIRQNRRIRAMSRRLREQHQALIQHEKMVAMGQMAAGIAHEIANPLASMDSVLQLMQRRPERSRPDAVAVLRDQIERISQIIQQMTAFAHPSDTRWRTVAVNDLIEQALAMVRFDRRLRNVKLHRQLSPQAGEVSVQPQSIHQVLINLTLNALDAVADVPQPQIVIRTEAVNGWVAIAISDNGHGIASENLRRLFEPFFTTKPVGKGTGLGLSISYSLIHNHGGRIEVSSEAGCGAVFTVWLPAAENPSAVPASGRKTLPIIQ